MEGGELVDGGPGEYGAGDPWKGDPSRRGCVLLGFHSCVSESFIFRTTFVFSIRNV